jgi:hypothetical protein
LHTLGVKDRDDPLTDDREEDHQDRAKAQSGRSRNAPLWNSALNG